MVPWKIELAVSKNQASLRYRTAVIAVKGRLLGGPGSPSRRTEEVPDERVSFLLCASLFHGGRAARWRRSLHEVVLQEAGRVSIYPVMPFTGLSTCCECRDRRWCPVTGWTEPWSSPAPWSGTCRAGWPLQWAPRGPATTRRVSPVPSPSPQQGAQDSSLVFVSYCQRLGSNISWMLYLLSGFLHTWWSSGLSKPTSFMSTWERVTSGFSFPALTSPCHQ